MRTALVLSGSVVSFFLIEFLVFHTEYYRSILKPESSTGIIESILANEKRRPVRDRRQIVSVGDSRMGFFPKYENELKLPYAFATIGAAGSTPRCWYYMLRDVDPTAKRYSAIVVPVENYDDAEIWENYADRITDLSYMIEILGWRDLWEFPRSLTNPSLKWRAFRGLVLKGLVNKTDFQDLIQDPAARLKDVEFYRQGSAIWAYDYVGPADSLKDVKIDFKARTIEGPPEVMAAHRLGLRIRFLDPQPPQTGRHSAYLHFWLGKICDYYRNSGTRVIFIRLPRGGFIRPDQPPSNPNSSVRDCSKRPNVTLAPEHFFDDLERPDLFGDEVHLSGPGTSRFSVELAHLLVRLLEPSDAI